MGKQVDRGEIGARIDGRLRHDTQPADRAWWGPDEPSAIDLSLIRIVYGVVAAGTRCSKCGSPLGRRLRVITWPTLFGPARWRVSVSTKCSGRWRHLHTATVGRCPTDLALGSFRARST